MIKINSKQLFATTLSSLLLLERQCINFLLLEAEDVFESCGFHFNSPGVPLCVYLSSQHLTVSKYILYPLAIALLSFLSTTLLQFLSIFQADQVISRVGLLVNMIHYDTHRGSSDYVLPGHFCNLDTAKCTEHLRPSPVHLQSDNH